MKLAGSITIVTGASRGIGRAVARAASAKGATVGLVARSAGDLERVLSECGGRGAIAVADVTRRDEVEGALDALSKQLGPIDVLVNNAGAGAYGAFADTDVETFEQMILLNYLGTVYAMKATLPGMLERGRGCIVNVASIAGRVGAPLESAYSASKFAVAGLSETVDIECRGRGVRVCLVDPGPVATDFFDARGAPYARTTPKPVSPDRVARAVVAAVERGKPEQYVPRWLRIAPISRHLIPAAYRAGAGKIVR